MRINFSTRLSKLHIAFCSVQNNTGFYKENLDCEKAIPAKNMEAFYPLRYCVGPYVCFAFFISTVTFTL